MKNTVFTFILLLQNFILIGKTDTSIYIKKTEFEELKTKVDEVKRDQLNYLIEKDLLKETYSNNYDRINIILTLVFGLFAVLSYLGFKDINTTKKEYLEELDILRKIKQEMELKSNEFQSNKEKYDNEIKEIINLNEEQNRKIKLLEIKERTSNLFKAKSYDLALENCVVGLELFPNDITLLTEKAKCLSKLNRRAESIKYYENALQLLPNDNTIVVNLIEMYLFENLIEKGDALIASYSTFVGKKQDIILNEFFTLLKNYHSKDISAMKDYAKKIIDKDNLEVQKQLKGWDFTDALQFLHSEPASEARGVCGLIVGYMNGNINGKMVSEKLNIVN